MTPDREVAASAIFEFDDSAVSKVAALMRDVAKRKIMPHFGGTGFADIKTKMGPLDPVTLADQEAEAALIAGLKEFFPDIMSVGEESCAADPALYSQIGGTKPVFVIDPIDGTQNFASGLPLFGVMIALIEGDEILAGLIYDPIRDDTVVARAGGGAFLLRHDQGTYEHRIKLKAAGPRPLDQMIAAISWQYMGEAERGVVLRNLVQLGQVPNFRCAAHTYRALAMGHLHAAVSRRTLAWDHAAGALIAAEAGAYVRRIDGHEFDSVDRDGGILVAPDETSWKLLREALFCG